MGNLSRNGASVVLAALALAMAACASGTAGDADYAIITTNASDISGKIYPAYVSKVDDREIKGGSGRFGRKEVVRVEPGVHRIRLTADLSQATGVLSKPGYTPRDKQPGDIEIEVEAGKRYFLGAQLTANRRDEWEPVVWRVEDIR
ncbi:MAG: hypothetical protein PVG91_04340 [Gammaproteobacteria bacterium]|jgi:hypothetical protein